MRPTTTGPRSSTVGTSRPPAAGESARERFEAYLETLQKAVGLKEQIAAYEDASRNRDVVTRVTGSVASSERDRLFMGFNTPLVPEVLIVTTVGTSFTTTCRGTRPPSSSEPGELTA